MTKRVAIRHPSFIEFETECGIGDTFDPSITLRAGCPYTPVWSFGNGDTATGATVSYAGFADAGPHTIRLALPRIDYWLTGIDVYNDKITGDFLGALTVCASLTAIVTGDNTNLASNLSSLAGLTQLTTLDLREHQWGLVGDIAHLAGLSHLTYIYAAGTGVYGDIGDLGALTQLVRFDLHSNTTGPGIHGDLADIAGLANVTYLSLGNTFVTGELGDLNTLTKLAYLMLYTSGGPGTGLVGGSISDIPALDLLAYLQVGGSQISGGNVAGNPRATYLLIENLGWSQATVDAFLASLYANRMIYSYAEFVPHILRIHGTNAAPSGLYQNATPPTTGREYIYKLEHDPDGEGFIIWDIGYTGE